MQFHMLSQVDWVGTVGVDRNTIMKRATRQSVEIRRRIRKKLAFFK